MSKFKITKPVDFGPYTITGPTGLQSDKVPLNNYAPKVGQVIEGNIVTMPVNNGNGQTVTRTGIVWPIRTNGNASTQAQTSIQFIPQDYFEPYVEETPQSEEPTTITPGTPENPETPNGGDNGSCWICDNVGIIVIVVLLTILLFLFFSDSNTSA